MRDQAVILATRLRRLHVATFRTLTEDAGSPPVVIGRFLALLELYREGVLAFEQPASLGELTVRWIGRDNDSDDDAVDVLVAGSSFDEDVANHDEDANGDVAAVAPDDDRTGAGR